MRTVTHTEERIIAKCQVCGGMFDLVVGKTEKESQAMVLEAIRLHNQGALKCAECVFKELGYEFREVN